MSNWIFISGQIWLANLTKPHFLIHFWPFWLLLIRKWPNPPFLNIKIHFLSKPNEFFKKGIKNLVISVIWPLGGYTRVSQRTLDTWNGMLWEIFLNLKPMEIAKRPYNIICRSIKVMHFCQIIRAWLNIGACHAHLKFEI